MSEVLDEKERSDKLPVPSKLKMTIVCLRISTILYVSIGAAAMIFIPEPVFGSLLLVICLALAAGVEIVIYGLKNYKPWGWITGLIVCILYIPSLFIILGGLGLWGLLDAETKSRFPEIT